MFTAKTYSVAIVLLLLLGSVSADAANYWVSTYGNDATGDGTFDKPYKTIAKGLDVAGNYDSVWVKSGTYSGDGNRNLSFGGQTTILHGYGGGLQIL